jgi:hypothetical protein
MFRRVAHRVGRPQAQQTDPRALLDAAVEPAAKRASHPGLGEDAAAGPQMNRQECVSFTVYVAIGILIVLFLAATGMVWWLGG